MSLKTPARWVGWQCPLPEKGEIPVSGETIRRRLSPAGRGSRPMGRSRFCAIKRAMGLERRGSYFISQFLAFLREFPDFTETEVYARERKEQFAVGQVLRLMHGPHEYRFLVQSLDAAGRPAQLTLAT